LLAPMHRGRVRVNMRISRLARSVIWLLLPTLGPCQEQKIPELNTILMESTFKIQGPKKGEHGSTSFGTTFLVGKPKPEGKEAYYVLVTAAHVLDEIDGDTAQLLIRKKKADSSYTSGFWPIRIRDKGKDLYAMHKEYESDKRVDAAALYVDMPNGLDITLLATDFLAADSKLDEFDVHPGDELFCLGFPLYVGTESGFPILRSGTIASYPLTPTSIYKNLLFDITVFEGNSGGPVYFVDRNRIYKGRAHLGGPIQFVVGLLKGEVEAIYYNKQEISLAVVVPARYIIETINLLPPESPHR